MVHRPLLPAGGCLPDRRFAADALPGLDAFAGRPEVEAFFDFADLGDFADFDGFGGRWPDLRSLPPLSFSPLGAVWWRGDFLFRLPAAGSPSA